MQQHYTLLFYTFFTASLWLVACRSGADCRELTGRWTDREGQEWIFMNGGNALWLTKFGSRFDTVKMQYELDCGAQPAAIDLNKFSGGPYEGKTLFGIVEWLSDTSLRMQYESGMAPDIRPEGFDQVETVKMYREGD